MCTLGFKVTLVVGLLWEAYSWGLFAVTLQLHITLKWIYAGHTFSCWIAQQDTS